MANPGPPYLARAGQHHPLWLGLGGSFDAWQPRYRGMVTPDLSEPLSGAPVNLLPSGLPVLPEELLSANLFSGQDPR